MYEGHVLQNTQDNKMTEFIQKIEIVKFKSIITKMKIWAQ
jgi:hypothetical protein